MTNFDRTKQWLKDADQKPEHLNAQIAASIEEFCEYLMALRWSTVSNSDVIEAYYNSFESLDNLKDLLRYDEVKIYENAHISDFCNLADAIADVKVTVDGVAAMFNFDQNEIDKRVLDSNDAKLVTVDGVRKAVRNESGKIMKPEGWESPDFEDLFDIDASCFDEEE